MSEIIICRIAEIVCQGPFEGEEGKTLVNKNIKPGSCGLCQKAPGGAGKFAVEKRYFGKGEIDTSDPMELVVRFEDGTVTVKDGVPSARHS